MKHLVDITYETYTSGAITVPCVIAQPKESGSYPCIIYNRGGNREFGKITPAYGEYLVERIASWGYIVVASQYRGLIGEEGADEFGGADVDDVVNLISVLKSLPNADTQRIGMFGWSRGGMMVYLALKKMHFIKAAVSVAGVADLLETAKRRPEMKKIFEELISTGPDLEEKLKERSIVYWPEKLPKVPLLLMHGTADWRVNYEQSVQLANELTKRNFPVTLKLFTGGDHALTDYDDEVWKMTKEWFEKYA